MTGKWKRLLLCVIAIGSLILSACGGGGSSSGGAAGGSTDPVGITGRFIDSAVDGLGYKCSPSGTSGITADGGEFIYREDDTVEFFVGGYSIGSATAKKYITPYDLHPGNDTAAIDVARLLLTLDSDGDPTNGITISDVLPTSLGEVTTRPGQTNFATDLSNALGESIVSAVDAQTHLENSYQELSSTWDYHLDIDVPFYNVFFEEDEWKIITFTLTSETAAQAVFEGTTYPGTWDKVEYQDYDEILNITVTGPGASYFRILDVEENRLEVCFSETLEGIGSCDIEYIYFTLADAQAHGGGSDSIAVYIQNRSYESDSILDDEVKVYASISPYSFDDVMSIKLFNSNGDIVIQNNEFNELNDIQIFYDCRDLTCNIENYNDNYYFLSTNKISNSGDYKFSIDFEDGITIEKIVHYPGSIPIPYIKSETVQAYWNEDDILIVRWENPINENNWNLVSQIRIAIYSVNDPVFILSVRINPDMETVTIESGESDDLSNMLSDDLWIRVNTRAHDENGMNYSRSYSDWILLEKI